MKKKYLGVRNVSLFMLDHRVEGRQVK